MNLPKPRFLRLLPSVILVSGGLLVLNASGIVHDAYAQGTAPATDALSAPVATGNTDFAGGDTQIASASEVDVLSALSKRRGELDQRQAELDTQANMLTAAEARVDTKINQLKALQTQIAALLQQRDDAQKAQIAALVKTYSSMKPKDAARIFDSLPDNVLVPVAQQMKSDVMALILASMQSDNAKALTVKLADKLALPDTADALAPVAAPAAPVPGAQGLAAPTPGTPTASAAPASATAPVQTASAAPAPASAKPAAATAAPAAAPATAPAAAAKPK